MSKTLELFSFTEEELLFFNNPSKLEAGVTPKKQVSVVSGGDTPPRVIHNSESKTPAGRLFIESYQYGNTVSDTMAKFTYSEGCGYLVLSFNGKTFITRRYEGIVEDLEKLGFCSDILLRVSTFLENVGTGWQPREFNELPAGTKNLSKKIKWWKSLHRDLE